MEAYSIEALSFYYPEQDKPALNKLSFSVHEGEFLTLCGSSGSGKSTLLRQLKTVLASHGRKEGNILFYGTPLDEVGLREQSSMIGFVQQSAENQTVTDKVWHELAFGLESLGYETADIRGRVAEMASFFGIQNWFYKNVSELSGGQKQLLNLASVMVMQPKVLILDEPTSQLDPIAASDFLATIGRINRELGTTVIITEHRLEEVFPMSDRVIVMDEGSLIADGSVRGVGAALREKGHSMFLAMPAAMRVWASTDSNAECPITVRDGRNWLEDFSKEKEFLEFEKPVSSPADTNAEPVVELSDIWFKYEKELPDVLRGLSMKLCKGEFLALLGGNGAGKSTTLSVINGLNKPYRGEFKVNGRLGALPQNPQTLFVKKTVREDLYEMLKGLGLSNEEQEDRVARAVYLCRLEPLLDRHPYDLSGGEQQRAALAKVLLIEPDILLLDEPTKGLDAEFKQSFAMIIKALQVRGVSILMVSHDVEFCAEYADRCALFFDGSVVTDGAPRDFFSGNSFYTTSANRMARFAMPRAVTVTDLIAACGGKLPPEPELIKEAPPVARPEKSSAEIKKLPWWRKLLAAVSGLAALGVFIYSVSITDLSAFVSSEGLSSLTKNQMLLYGVLIIALFIFAASISKRSETKDYMLQQPAEKRRLNKRTVLAAALILLLIPLTIFVGVYYLESKKYYFVSLLILIETMLPFFMVFESRKPQPRELVTIAVLCALGIAGRAAFFALPNFKPVIAIVIIAGVAFGGETGFLVGAVTMLVSNMMFGQGPWMPWQMFAMGIIGFIAGVLFRKGLLRRNRLSLCIFGAIMAVVVYGGIMNPAAALMWAHTIDLKILLTYYITGVPVDLIHACATWLFLWFAAEPMLEKLDRIKIKYGLVE